jgi:hypothetical protein
MLFREKKNRLFIGLELNHVNAQISFCSSEKPEPETVSLVAGKEQFAIPTVLCKRKGVNQWFFGRDAQKRSEEEEGILVDRLLARACAGEQITLEEEQFDAVSLLALFVKHSLSVMLLGSGVERPDYLMITVEQADSRMLEVLSGVGSYLQMDREHLFFQSHAESFYQYCMHQPEELRTHEVMIFEYASDYLKSYRLEYNRKTNPIVAFTTQKEFPDMRLTPFSEDETAAAQQARQRDEEFAAIIGQETAERIVSCVYLIGDGYQGDWCKESLRLLCSKRRVFQGNNLYSKGACYAAYERIHPGSASSKYIFLGRDKIKVNIGMNAVVQGREQYYPLIDAGVNWFDVKRECDLMLESGNELTFVLTPLNGAQRRVLVMKLNGLPEEGTHMTRLHMALWFPSEERFAVRVEDLGFGSFFESSGLSWEQEVAVSQERAGGG